MSPVATTSCHRWSRSASASIPLLLAIGSELLLTLGSTVAIAAAPDRQTLLDALCRGRSACRVGLVQEAGRSGDQELWVVEVALADEPASLGVVPTPGACSTFERWVVARQQTGAISAHPLVVICNDGYGSRGLGEDQIEVGPNRFTHTRVGGSAWMWANTSVVQLAPLVLISKTRHDWWTLGDSDLTVFWRWTDWVGFGESSAASCEGPGRPHKGLVTSTYQPIPRVALEDDFRASGWRTADFSACASRIDSRGGASQASPGGGFVTFGKPALRGEATVRMLLSRENELFIEVLDETPVPSAKSWLFADHLELWLGTPMSSFECSDHRGPLHQWGIGLDGTVYPAFGHPEQQLDVERAELRSSIRFKVRLPAGLTSTENRSWRIAVAYSESDSGKGQKRIIATSKLTYGSLPTLGRIKDIPETLGACLRDGDVFRPVVTRSLPDDEPIIDPW